MGNTKRHFDTNYGAPLYQEKLGWPWWLWAFALFLTGSISLAVWAAISPMATIIISVIQFLLLILASIKTKLIITITKGWLLVGPAAIERAYLKNFSPLAFTELAKTRGVDGDPAAFLQLRFWVNSAIKIELRDPKDETPYWLISTNRANDLANVLNSH
jgi:hypothetical protein